MDWLASDLQRPLILGHRGASADAPENTLAAFAVAKLQGADGIELDVRLSADGQPVVMHDARVDRTTNGRGRVSRLTAAELQALEVSAGQSVPTLAEVFTTFGPQLLYNIELKTFGLLGNARLATAVADCIQAHDLADKVVVSSFNPLLVRQARRQLPRATMVAHLWYNRWLKYKVWLAPAEAHHPHRSLVDADYVAWARRNGWRVHVWTVDDSAEAQRLADLGVHALITNKPETIRACLA